MRADGQKVLLAIKTMGGESEAAWRALLDDLVRRGLPRPELVVVDGAPGLEKALAALWPDMAVQRCTVQASQSPRPCARAAARGNLERLQRYDLRGQRSRRSKGGAKPSSANGASNAAPSPTAWRKPASKLFTFTRFPLSQWKSIRTSNAIERLHEEFKRRIKTQTVLPCADAAMLFWALLASGQITMRKVDGWQSLAEKPDDQIIDLAA